MELVCFQGSDKESWGQINALVKRGEWDKVVVVRNKRADNISFGSKCEFVNVSSDNSLIELKKEIQEKLGRKIGKDFEVALSIASGSGKEHMAMISALLSIPVGIRLVAFTKKGVEFVN